MSTGFSPEQNTRSTPQSAEFASAFAALATPERVELLHTIATSISGITHHQALMGGANNDDIQALAASGLIGIRDEMLTVCSEALASTQLIADVVLGLSATPIASLTTVDPSIVVRKLTADDWGAVQRIYGEGIEAGNATFDTAVPESSVFDRRWHPEHRWVAQIDGAVCGWASVSPTSVRDFFSGVVEVSVYVGREALGLGIGKVLLKHLIEHADAAGLWTLQSSIFPDNTASLALHRSAGFRTVGVREKVARLHGVWRDTIIVERRSPLHFQGD